MRLLLVVTPEFTSTENHRRFGVKGINKFLSNACDGFLYTHY